MDTFDFLGEQVVTTPAGLVAITLASHEDGAVSVVAWLISTGSRVGYLYCQPRQRRPREELIEPALVGSVVRPMMEAMLEQALGHAPHREPIGQRLVRAGLMSEAELADLLGWQWLMAELGQPRRLGELAAHAGLLPGMLADDVIGGPVERRDPDPMLTRALPRPEPAVAVASIA